MKRIILAVTAIGILTAQQRFDFQVRQNFFTGFAGDRAALDRGMKQCEEILAENPRHPEALVWHGGGLFFLSGQSFQKGDVDKGMDLYTRGIKEMEDAVSIAPDNVGVLIPRGASLLTATRQMPPGDPARKLLTQGLADFEKVYSLQKPYFDKLSGHARSELLFGLAEGYARAGNEAKAREYFEKLAAEGSAGGHEAEARTWLETGKIDSKRARCAGCHTGS